MFAGFVALVAMFFALPMLWLVFAPFNGSPTLQARPSRPTLGNFREVFQRDDVLPALRNSVILVVGAVAIVIAVGAPAAYALSRVRFPGRDLFLYLLLLLSSVITGAAAILPLYLLMFGLDMIDTYWGVWLALAGGMLPTSIFILKDFTDSIPRSYEESARVFGASSFQALRHVVLPVIRPGIAVIAVWGVVQVWGNFLVPFILLRSADKSPAAVLMFSFSDEAGRADLRGDLGVRPHLHAADPAVVLVRQQALRVPLPRRDQALMAGIDINDLTKVYPGGVRALDALDLTIDDGEFFALLGPSGCGKIDAAAHDRRTRGGDRGHAAHRRPRRDRPAARRSHVAMVFQDYALYPHMTVRDNIAYPLRIKKVAKAKRHAEAERVGASLSLDGPDGPPARSAVGRSAAARRAGPGGGHPSRRVPVRRTVVEPRRPTAARGADLHQASSSATWRRRRCSSPTTRARRSPSPTAWR